MLQTVCQGLAKNGTPEWNALQIAGARHVLSSKRQPRPDTAAYLGFVLNLSVPLFSPSPTLSWQARRKESRFCSACTSSHFNENCWPATLGQRTQWTQCRGDCSMMHTLCFM